MARVIGTGLSALDERRDLPEHLDELAALGCETVELPLYTMDIVVGGRVREAALKPVRAACAGRPFRYTVHGPLAINFFDEAFRLPRHFDVLKASMEVSAELGAIHYVIHAGMMPVKQVPAIEDAYLAPARVARPRRRAGAMRSASMSASRISSAAMMAASTRRRRRASPPSLPRSAIRAWWRRSTSVMPTSRAPIPAPT